MMLHDFDALKTIGKLSAIETSLIIIYVNDIIVGAFTNSSAIIIADNFQKDLELIIDLSKELGLTQDEIDNIEIPQNIQFDNVETMIDFIKENYGGEE